MRCTNCQAENPDEKRFCGNCGEPLHNRCSLCGAKSPPANKFCGECGAPLTNVMGPASATRAEPDIQAVVTNDTLVGERKIVTALFADLKGSTELLESLDPEEGRAIVEPLLRIMSDSVHRYEGYLVRTTGDGIFALFGASAAYEDHPQRALYAALQMQQQLRSYGQDHDARGLQSLEARVGVHTVLLAQIGALESNEGSCVRGLYND